MLDSSIRSSVRFVSQEPFPAQNFFHLTLVDAASNCHTPIDKLQNMRNDVVNNAA